MVVVLRMDVKVLTPRVNLAELHCALLEVIIPGALRKALLARGFYTSDTCDSVPLGNGAALRLGRKLTALDSDSEADCSLKRDIGCKKPSFAGILVGHH